MTALVEATPQLARRRASRVRSVARYSRSTPLTTTALAFLVLLIVVAALAPVIAPFDPLEFHRVDRLQGPGAPYLLGTDASGRDQLSRIIYGARVSLYVGVAPIVLSTIAGTVFGTVSAYRGGAVDLVIQRFAEALMAIPPMLVAITVVAVLGPSLNNVVLAIATVTIPLINRVSRAATLQVVPLQYVLSARAVGASNLRIMLVHIVPNIAGPIIVVGASLVGTAILTEAGLSFLGLGVRPPDPTWGNMIGGENRVVSEVAPWLVIFPGIAISLTVLAFNLAGDGLRDLLDPRSRNGRG